MSEGVMTSASENSLSVLRSTHAQMGAEFQSYGDIEIVSTFGEPQAEYASLRARCGLMELAHRGVIRVRGKDRLAFLNNLFSNLIVQKDTKTPLEIGQGVYAFLLQARNGKIIADTNVMVREDHVLLETDARLIEPLTATLTKYQFAEDVKFENGRAIGTGTSDSTATVEFALHGPEAALLLERACGTLVSLEAPLSSTTVRIIGQEITVWRDDETGSTGLHLLTPESQAVAIWNHLLNLAGNDHGKRAVRPVGWAAFNTTRIEAGRALFGIDFDDTFLPAETSQFSRGVSVVKGCYPGQEIVARMYARKQVAKQVAGIRMDTDHLPIAGEKCFDDQGNAVGGITSSTISPVLSRACLVLAVLKRPFFTVGTKLNIPAEGAMRTGTVVELPFLAK